MSLGKDECNKVGVRAGGLTSKAGSGVIEGHMHPSVGQFKTNKVPLSLVVKCGPPRGIRTINITARSIAPTCNYGVFNTKVLERSLKGSYGSK